jgi:aspartate kinase
MQVFKFGGASLKDAENIKNVADIIDKYKSDIGFVVISALGKTTNALEMVINLYVNKNDFYIGAVKTLIESHLDICKDLFKNEDFTNVEQKLNSFQDAILDFLGTNTNNTYTFIYDQIVPYGELLSSTIVGEYLTSKSIKNEWIDARTIICTDSNYTEAKVDFEASIPKIKALLKTNEIKVTQGFIAKNNDGYTTTLGREGSDYTAAVISYCIDASKMVIWKDVPAVLNADPRIFKDTITLPKLSYREAIEMTYYGAQVIHPKTIKPLQNKQIPLQVRSFIDKDSIGTIIGGNDEENYISYPPIIVYKTNQVLVSISVKDFSFIAEENLSTIFKCFSNHGLRMNMTHSGAISFSACIENKMERIKSLVLALSNDFEVKYNESLELLTIRHYTQEKIDELTKNKNILLTHKTRTTIQILMRNEE